MPRSFKISIAVMLCLTVFVFSLPGMSVRSEQGQGAEFHVALDLEKAAEREPDAAFPDWRALVVDGDKRLCANTVRILESAGIRAEGCQSVEQAMTRIADGGYQPVLLGESPPDMNGTEAARAIRTACGEDGPAMLLLTCDWSRMAGEAREAEFPALFPSRCLSPPCSMR